MKPIWLKVAETPIREEHYQRAVERCLASGRVDSGPAVERLEEEFARRLVVPREWVLSCQSCTAGMGMCFHFLGLSTAGRTRAPAITWPGSYCMGRGVEFYDCVPWGQRYDTVVLVDLFGAQDIRELAHGGGEGHPTYVLDAAHNVLDRRHGGYLRDGLVQAVVYSFGAVKQLSGIRGGLVVCPRITDEWRAYRHYGVHRDRLPELPVGGNFDMNEFSAELILAQLDEWKETQETSQCLLRRYVERLRGVPGLKVLERGSGHLFVVWTKHRDRLRDALRFEGIETSVHYKLPTWINPLDYPMSREHANIALTLPLHSRMGIAEVDAVCDVVTNELGDSGAALSVCSTRTTGP